MSQLNVTTLKHESAGVDNITLDANGSVGFGTSNPTSAISLGASIGKNVAVFENAGGNNIYGIGMTGDGGTNNPYRTRIFANGFEYLSVDYAGRVTMPYQPMFTANNPSTATLLSGSYWKFGGWTAIKNIGGHYNASSGVFTAPVAGVYFFRTVIMGYDNGVSSSPHVGFSLNGSDNVGGQAYGANALWEHHNNANHKTDSTQLFYLNANDSVAVRALSSGINQPERTYFMGCLLG